MFDYDWFNGAPLQQQRQESKRRCTVAHFSNLSAEEIEQSDEATHFRSELTVRCLVYLRDGFSYEVRELADLASKTHLAFECEPVDDQYKVGSFVVSVPFEEIVRVEVFAVHPTEKPDEMPQITGFRGSAEPAAPAPVDTNGQAQQPVE